MGRGITRSEHREAQKISPSKNSIKQLFNHLNSIPSMGFLPRFGVHNRGESHDGRMGQPKAQSV